MIREPSEPAGASPRPGSGIPSDLETERGHKSVATPRAVAMYNSRRHTKDSYPDLARAFGDSTGVRKVVARRRCPWCSPAIMRHLVPALAALAALLAPAVASAHIRITSPTPRSADQLKQRHCGQTGGARANVQTYRPGAPLHLVWDEYVSHPGWFRISFQQTGDTFEIPPVSNGVTGSGAASNYPTENLTGKTDPATGSLIIADRIAHGTSSFDLTLPDLECGNCTLQLIQMMTDKPPYAADTTSDDIYFQCVDLVLSASAPPPDAGTGAGTGGTSGGCSSSGGTPGLVLIAALGLLRRRRRPAAG